MCWRVIVVSVIRTHTSLPLPERSDQSSADARVRSRRGLIGCVARSDSEFR
jgi:hypothetical protein